MSLPIPNPVGYLDTDKSGQRIFVLTERWHCPIDGVGLLEADPGCYYDGQSIPRPFWPLVGDPFDPRSQAAACAHDLIGRAQLPNAETGKRIHFAEWNRIFYTLCVRNGNWLITAWRKYAGLMAGGWVVWRSHKRNRKQILGTRKFCRMLPLPVAQPVSTILTTAGQGA